MATIVSVLPPTTAILGVPIFLFATPEAISAYTGGQVKPSDILPEWIADAIEEVERQSGFCIQPKAFTEVLDGDGSGAIFLHCFPLIEIQSITINDNLIPPEKYVVTPATGVIRLKDNLLKTALYPFMPFFFFRAFDQRQLDRGVGNVVVKGIRGYTMLPPLVQKICSLIVAKTALQAKSGPIIEREAIGGFSQRRGFEKINDELDRAWAALGKRRPMFSV